MPEYYLGGPMRGHAQFNFPAFFDAAEKLRKTGLSIKSPAEHDIELGFTDWATAEVFAVPGYGLADAIKWDLEVLCSEECLGIILLPGWQESSGASLELHTVQFLGKDVFEYHDSEWTAWGYNLTPLPGYKAGAPIQTSTPREVPVGYYDTVTELAETLPAGETRIANPETGGEKGQKGARFDLIPSDVLWWDALLYGKGAEKYAARNWEKGYDFSLSYAALQRHANLFWQGEDFDQEMGVPHMSCVRFHAAALIRFVEEHPELDDRAKGTTR